MPKIGKGAYVPTSLVFDFTLTVNGTDYHIDKKSASSSVANVYDYVREDKGWYLVVYANASLTFAKLKHLVDLCCVGGGGGGGGGSSGGSGYYQSHGKDGGPGGGGYVTAVTRTLSSNTAYSITIGTGGSAGGAGWNGTGQPGSNGGNGTATSFGELLTANGGGGGSRGWDAGGETGTAGAGDEVQYCFSDEAMPYVSGVGSGTSNPSRRGQGGGKGSWGRDGDNPYSTPGKAGANGLFVIRSSR